MRKLALLLLIPVLAVLAWLLFLHHDTPQPSSGGSEVPAAQPQPENAAAMDAPTASRLSAVPDAAPAGVHGEKVGAGRFGLHGKVVDEGGAAVPGAWVAAYSSPFPILDFEFDIQEIFTHPLSFALEPLASTFADAGGEFDLAGVPGRTTYLVARSFRRLTPGRQRVLPEELDTEDGVLVHTVAGADLKGTVVDAAGHPVAGAEVLIAPGLKYLIAAFRNRHLFAERVFTDGAGHFSVDAVPAEFSLAAAAFDGPVKSGLCEFGPLSAGASGSVEVRLDALGGLSGEVSTTEEKPAAGAMVVAVPLDLRRLVPFVRNPGAWAATTSSSGRYRFDELPRGPFLIIAQGRQGRSAPMQTSVISDGSLAPTLVLDSKTVTRGRVLNAKGQPVAGAEVQLMSIPSAGEDRGDAWRRPGGILFEAAQQLLPELLPNATSARTGSDGGFQLAAWHQARLRVSAPGYVTCDYELAQIGPDKEPVLLLYQPGSVSGVVTDAARGKPVQFFLVRAEAERLAGAAVREARGDDQGDRGNRRRREDAATVEEDAGEAQSTPTEERVRAAMEQDFAGLAAALHPQEELVTPEESWRSKIKASAFCDGPDGRFLLNDLPPGTWTITVQAEGYAQAEHTEVPVRTGETTADVALVLNHGAIVSGRVVAKGDGRPVEGAVVTVGRGEELGFTAMLQGLDQSTAIGTSEADGSFVIQGARTQDDHVNVTATGFSSATQEIAPLQEFEQREDVLVELAQGGAITGLVTDRNGVPLPGRMVGAFSMQARDFQQTATNERGSYRMEHMRPGSYFLLTAGLDDESLFTGDFMSMLNSSRILTGYVAEGETTTVDIVDTSANACRLRGKLVKAGTPVPGASLAMFGTERSGLLDFRLSMGRTDEYGEFEFKSLAPGEYVMNVDSEDWNGQLELEVDDVPEDYQVLEVPRTVVHGQVVAERTGGPVAQASVQLVREDGLANSMFGMFGGGGGGGDTKWSQTDERGEYRFEGISPGNYHIEVTGQRMWGGEQDDQVPLGRAKLESFELGENEVKEVETIRLQVAGNIQVTIVDRSGNKLEDGMRLRAVPLQKDPAHAGAEDEERLRGFGWGGTGWVRGIPAGDYRVEVECEGYAPASQSPVTVREGETADVQITLQRGATLNLRLLDPNNRPIGDAKVELLNSDGALVNEDQRLGSAFARLFGGNQDGSYPLGTFVPGSYTVRVTWDGRTREVPVSLVEGETKLTEVRF